MGGAGGVVVDSNYSTHTHARQRLNSSEEITLDKAKTNEQKNRQTDMEIPAQLCDRGIWFFLKPSIIMITKDFIYFYKKKKNMRKTTPLSYIFQT